MISTQPIRILGRPSRLSCSRTLSRPNCRQGMALRPTILVCAALAYALLHLFFPPFLSLMKISRKLLLSRCILAPHVPVWFLLKISFFAIRAISLRNMLQNMIVAAYICIGKYIKNTAYRFIYSYSHKNLAIKLKLRSS